MKNKGWEVDIAILCPQFDQLQIHHHLKDTYEDTVWVRPGDEKDVFSRYDGFQESVQAEYLMRVTADCPYWAPSLSNRLLAEMRLRGSDFAWIRTPQEFPDGLDVELIRHDLWHRMTLQKKHEGILEHVTIGLKGTWETQPEKPFILPKDDAYDLGGKLSIDTLKDLETVEQLRKGIWWIPSKKNSDHD